MVKVYVILSLCVRDVSEMCIEQVVAVQTYLEHLLHSAAVGGDVAVGSDEEGVFVSFGSENLHVTHVVLEILVRHQHAVLYARACNQHSGGADLLAGGEGYCHYEANGCGK